MSKEPKRNVYVGHRYVPKIMGEWDQTIKYEGLSIVLHKGHSYTSKGFVPVGIDIKDEKFWALTGNYNAQVEDYRQEVERYKSRIDENKENIILNSDDIEKNKSDIINLNTKVDNKVTDINKDIATNKSEIIKNNDRFNLQSVNVFDYIDSAQIIKIKNNDEEQNFELVTQGILNAVKDLGVNSNTLYFPSGTYMVTNIGFVGDYNTSINIRQDNVNILGEGKTSILKSAPESDSTIMRLGSTGTRLYKNITVENMVFDGNWDKQTWAGPIGLETSNIYDQNGLSVDAVDGVTLKNVHVRDTAQDGMGMASCKNIVVYPDCSVKRAGKGCLTFFLCANINVMGGVYENPVDSPSANKPVYTLSSDGYPALGVAYAPHVNLLGEELNNAVINNVTIKLNGRGRGRGITGLWNFTDLTINDSKITGGLTSGHLISVIKHISSERDDVYTVINNVSLSHTRLEGRSVHIIDIDKLKMDNVKIESGADTIGMVLYNVKRADLNNIDTGDIEEWALRFDGGGDIEVNRFNSKGDIIFLPPKIERFRINNSNFRKYQNSSLHVNDFYEVEEKRYKTFTAGRQGLLQPSEIQTIEFNAEGIKPTDKIISYWSTPNDDPNISKAIISAVIPEDNKITLSFYNPNTENNLVLLGNSWYVEVEINN